MAACQSLFNLLDLPVEKDTGQEQLPLTTSDVVLSNVTFSYPTKNVPTLKNVTLTIPQHKIVTIVGSSGGGKSTLIKLLTRFYDLDHGTIELHGRNIKDYTLTSLRRYISVVPQHIYLFNDTIAKNISYGFNGNCEDSQIYHAAEQARVTDFINLLPNGLDTLIGENGYFLSGGQRQRVAIARALLRNSKLLIFDEATSALDIFTEYSLHQILQNLKQQVSILIVAHRRSTIAMADHVVVLENGRIMECGERRLLLNNDSKYKQLYN